MFFSSLLQRKDERAWMKSLPQRVQDRLLIGDILMLIFLIGVAAFIGGRVTQGPAASGWSVSAILDGLVLWCVVSCVLAALLRSIFLRLPKVKEEPARPISYRMFLRDLVRWRSLLHIALMAFCGLTFGASMRMFVRPDTPVEAMQDWRLAVAVWFLYGLTALMLPHPTGRSYGTFRYALICVSVNGLGFALARLLIAA